MKVFIDIEANQFSGHMMSIGCACENGETFYSLIALPKGEKPTKFITNLTGITREDLSTASSPDEVFTELASFLKNVSCEEPHFEFYCYGNEDPIFINRTIKHMTDFQAIILAMSIAGNLIDYSKEVQKYYGNFKSNPPSLHNAYNFVIAEENEQKHNALEDAMMLKTVYEKLFKISIPADGEKVYGKPRVREEIGKKKEIPDYVRVWLNGNIGKWKAPTCNTGAEMLYCKVGNKIKKFSSIEEAVYWCIVFNGLGSPKKEDNFNHVAKRVRNALQDGKPYLTCTWGLVE